MAQAVASAHRQSIHMFRKHIVFICYLFLLAGCATHEEMNDVKARLEALESTRIATVEEQVQSIRRSLTELESTDAALKDYISALEEGAGKLQESIDDASSRIAAMDALIIDLKEKDAELEGRIDALREYVDKQIKESKDWASATFSTLEQYNATVQELADIKADIIAVGENISDLDKELTGKMEAQATAFNAALASLESGLKQWVNEKLKSYCTIAEADAKLRVLELSVQEGDEQLAKELKALQGDLATQKADITAAYKQAIATAISENNGVIDGKIAAAVKEVNDKIDGAIETINGQLADLDLRLKGVEKSVAEILSMIQSIAVVPTYSDGAVAVGESETVIYFEIFPLEAAKKLEEVALTAFSLKAVSTTQTKADVNFVSLPVLGVKYEDGLVAVSTSGEALDAAFFDGIDSMNARLSISSGLSNLSSSYFVIAPQGNQTLTELRLSEYKQRVIDHIYVMDNHQLLIAFVDGTSLQFDQNSTVPHLYLDYDGNWSVSYNDGESTARLMNGAGEYIQAGNVFGDNRIAVRYVAGQDGRYHYIIFNETEPNDILENLGTPVEVDEKNCILSITEDDAKHTVTFEDKNGGVYIFRKLRVTPTSLCILTNKIKLAQGCTVNVEFRVNPSNACFNYDVTSPDCEISLDMLGETTKSSYVTAPTYYKLTKVEQVYNEMGIKKEGQYRAHIADLGLSMDYDELVSLVLTIKNGYGEKAQLSSSAMEIAYSSELITEFKFLQANNPQLLADATATIEGNNITILTPFILDASAMIATFTTSGASAYVEGQKQESGVSVQDFTQPVKYYVDKNEYIVTIKKSELPVVFIDTPGGTAINSKTVWTADTKITIYNPDGSVDYTDDKLNIRGRGNSTWGYPKKPYALKLDKKASILGMPKHKRWVLLANWMDRTLLRNATAFEISRKTGLAWTPRGQFVEVVLNGRYIGNYFLCEQIKIDENRVNIKEMKATDISGEAVTGGYLMELDVYFDEVNKFKSSVRNLPYMFKDPDEEVLQAEQLAYMQNYVNTFESVLYANNWLENRDYEDYIDIDSYIDMWFVFELAVNGEPNHPKSTYCYKDRGGKMYAGPVWDFDWATFRPVTGYSTRYALYYGRLFSDPEFVAEVKARWAACKPGFTSVLNYIDTVSEQLEVSNTLNLSMWPISSTVNGDESLPYDDAITRFKNAYETRLNWLDSAINNL